MLLKKGYIVLMNSKYMNTFKDYTKAYDFMESLQRKFPRAIIEIEPIY